MIKKPWDVRDPSPHGDSDENAIFNAVGHALTEWEHVETACARLFAVLVSAHQRRTYYAPAVRAYGSINSFKSRADMLSAAAMAYFSRRKAKRTVFEARFNEALKLYRGFSDRRNDIAHGCLQRVFLTEKAGKGRRPRAVGFYLLPSFYNPRKFKMDESFAYRYTSSDLIYYRQEFMKLQIQISGLREDLQRPSP
jgi:hypothetical protein